MEPQQIVILPAGRWLADRVRYPRQYVQEAARRNLLGLRFPKEYGGRGLGWADEIAPCVRWP